MNKIYCKNCKWYKWVDSYIFIVKACYKILSMKDTPTSQEAKFADCEIQNKNNDCSYYEPKWWKSK